MDTLAPAKITYDKFFIDGGWQDPSSRDRIEVHSASTGESIGSVPDGREADIDRAVAAARKAFDDPAGWSHWEPKRRARSMEKLAEILALHEEMAARLIRLERLQRAAAEAGRPLDRAATKELLHGQKSVADVDNALAKLEEKFAGITERGAGSESEAIVNVDDVLAQPGVSKAKPTDIRLAEAKEGQVFDARKAQNTRTSKYRFKTKPENFAGSIVTIPGPERSSRATASRRVMDRSRWRTSLP